MLISLMNVVVHLYALYVLHQAHHHHHHNVYGRHVTYFDRNKIATVINTYACDARHGVLC